ncbi:MAG: hypothetical protein JWP87_5648, partial [Labilithrix sp.]|nr:hypothetical protein [Labilithrix sp.]
MLSCGSVGLVDDDLDGSKRLFAEHPSDPRLQEHLDVLR